MTLRSSRDKQSDRKVVQATAGAIRSLERVIGTITEYRVGAVDAQNLHYIMQRLRSILENNNCCININTNRLRRIPP